MAGIDELAGAIDLYGIGSVEPEVRRLVEEARRTGLTTPALDVLDDPTAPAVVRGRAFSVVTRRMGTSTGAELFRIHGSLAAV